MHLVLFDIDGTLVSDGGAARDSFREALGTVFGYDRDLSQYDFSGRTDPQIARMVLRDAGVSDEVIDEGLDPLWELYVAALAQKATPGRVRTMPGIPELVEALDSRDDVVLALLTGNIEPGARLKLGGADLNRYFPFGAFGSDSADRTELPPVAVRRASQRLGLHFTGPEVVIIGDSIFDVRCGIPHRATTIAIASGQTSAAALRAERPTHLFESAEDRSAILGAILGEQ